jgi:hypothetical protein
MLIYMSRIAQSHITTARRETTSSTHFWTQTREDPAAATTRCSEFWVLTRQFLYFSFIKILITRLCMTCDEFRTIVTLYINLLWIVLEIVGFNYILICFGGFPSGEATKIGSSQNRRVYVPTWRLNSSANRRIYGSCGPAPGPHSFVG